MNIAIVGSGNGGSAAAAYGAYRGYSVGLFEPAPHVNPEHVDAIQRQGGLFLEGIKGDGFVRVPWYGPNDLSGLANYDIVVVHYVTLYHKELAEHIAPHLRDGQTIVFNPGYLGTCTLYDALHAGGSVPELTCLEFETLPFSSRIVAPGKVHIRAENAVHPYALWPTHELSSRVHRTLRQFIGPLFLRNDIVEIALHNPNLLMHTTGTILNATLVQSKQKTFSMYQDGFSPAVWNVVRALDEEKISVLRSLRYPGRPYFEVFQLRTYGTVDMDDVQAFRQFAAGSFPGPFTLAHRYVTEDVPQGLGLLHALGELQGVPTPVCESLITLAMTMVPDFPFEQHLERTRRRAERYVNYKKKAVNAVGN